MTEKQRGYLWSEVYPGFAYGWDCLLVANGESPRYYSPEDIHDFCKPAFGVKSTTTISQSQAADYISEIQALAARCLIFLATPEEWERGIADRVRREHYQMMLGEERMAA